MAICDPRTFATTLKVHSQKNAFDKRKKTPSSSLHEEIVLSAPKRSTELNVQFQAGKKFPCKKRFCNQSLSPIICFESMLPQTNGLLHQTSSFVTLTKPNYYTSSNSLVCRSLRPFSCRVVLAATTILHSLMFLNHDSLEILRVHP